MDQVQQLGECICSVCASPRGSVLFQDKRGRKLCSGCYSVLCGDEFVEEMADFLADLKDIIYGSESAY
jgi:hypothetical protein